MTPIEVLTLEQMQLDATTDALDRVPDSFGLWLGRYVASTNYMVFALQFPKGTHFYAFCEACNDYHKHTRNNPQLMKQIAKHITGVTDHPIRVLLPEEDYVGRTHCLRFPSEHDAAVFAKIAEEFDLVEQQGCYVWVMFKANLLYSDMFEVIRDFCTYDHNITPPIPLDPTTQVTCHNLGPYYKP